VTSRPSLAYSYAMSQYPDTGKTAPDFTAHVTGGDYSANSTVTLSALKGQNVLLYFYPKDDTPGCTTQACALRDGWDDLKERVLVFGVSPDAAESHTKFIEKFSLPFPLISDEDHAISEAYGVWVEKSMYGKTFMGVERSTFLIDAEGNLKAVFPKVKPDEHLEQVLAALG
jgi:thioredoxin-dependent peroxiredoxin